MGKVFTPPASIQKPEIGTYFARGGEGTQASLRLRKPTSSRFQSSPRRTARASWLAKRFASKWQTATLGTSCTQPVPVVLLHLPIGDAWQYQYANRLTASDIKEEVSRSNARSPNSSPRHPSLVPETQAASEEDTMLTSPQRHQRSGCLMNLTVNFDRNGCLRVPEVKSGLSAPGLKPRIACQLRSTAS